MSEFTVTEDHLKFLRNAYVGWDDCEFGAPAIDCKRPYGNSGVIEDIAELLDIKPEGEPDRWGESDFTRDQIDAMTLLHKQTQTVLQIMLVTCTLEPGHYTRQGYGTEWVRDAV